MGFLALQSVIVGATNLSEVIVKEPTVFHNAWKAIQTLIERPTLSSVAHCLDYRFETALRARELPNLFVVPSALLNQKGGQPNASEWLERRGYRLENSLFDSVVSEHPKNGEPLEWMSRIFIFKR